MNSDAQFWSIHCMDVRGQWRVMTDKGWAKENDTYDCVIERYQKQEASDRIARIISEVSWTFGVKMQDIANI